MEAGGGGGGAGDVGSGGFVSWDFNETLTKYLPLQVFTQNPGNFNVRDA